jgi:hypothetical protein
MTRRLAALLAVAVAGAGATAVTKATGRPTLMAARASEAIVVDGWLNERDWSRAAATDAFVQIEPREGAPASERTEVRVLFDDSHLYFGIRCDDTTGAADLRIRDLRRDFDETTDDFVGLALDGVGDGRSALVFRVNPLGALRDQQTVDGGLADVDFDAVWHARTSRHATGWTAELAIPWRTLRYRTGEAPWGFNVQRVIRRSNETVGWSPWPRAMQPFRMDYAGTLTGLQPPPPSRNLRFQPYARATAADGAAAAGEAAGGRGLDADVGMDLKWALTPNSVLDLTANPDFGQADVDRQIVNLTRFSAFFPERRQFFLENRGIFFTGNGQRFEPFFSRRIGLDADGEPVPITAGARYSTRGPRAAFGALAVSQRSRDDSPGSQFGVLRYVGNFGAQNRLGALVATRADNDGRTNVVSGIDGFYRPTRTSFVRGTITGSATSGPGGEGIGGFIWIANEAPWGYAGYISEVVTSQYDARSGFVLRQDYVRISPAVTLDWRPEWRPRAVRRFQPGFTLEHYVGPGDGAVQEGAISLRPLTVQLHNGGLVQYALQPNWQRPRASFRPVPGVDIAAGAYDYLRHQVTLQTDPSAAIAVRVEPSTGGYFNGHLDTLRTVVQATPDPRIAVSADYTVNRLRDAGMTRTTLTTHLLAVETRLAANPRVQFVTLAQWNTVARQLSVNARLAWEYRPLSYLNVIYNDRSPIDGRGVPVPPGPSSRHVLVKFTWMAQI